PRLSYAPLRRLPIPTDGLPSFEGIVFKVFARISDWMATPKTHIKLLLFEADHRVPRFFGRRSLEVLLAEREVEPRRPVVPRHVQAPLEQSSRLLPPAGAKGRQPIGEDNAGFPLGRLDRFCPAHQFMESQWFSFTFQSEGAELPGQEPVQPADHLIAHGDLRT